MTRAALPSPLHSLVARCHFLRKPFDGVSPYWLVGVLRPTACVLYSEGVWSSHGVVASGVWTPLLNRATKMSQRPQWEDAVRPMREVTVFEFCVLRPP